MSLECVVNVSEGRDEQLLERLAAACGNVLLDVHSDPDHHRSVLTLAGPDEMVETGVRMLAATAVSTLDIGLHVGEHPRIGVVDVVPFVPLTTTDLVPAMAARDRFGRWAGVELGLPCFFYGPLQPSGHRTLPQIRRSAFSTLVPDTGPEQPHPRAGACAVGARHFLVAYNVWVAGGDATLARSVAAAVRGPAVRTLGFDLAGQPQVSCNLVDPLTIGPAEVHDQIARLLEDADASVERCELVGLLPTAVLDTVPPARWPELGLRPEATIEARLEERGVSWR
jgi:glutamate formiminotransferase